MEVFGAFQEYLKNYDVSQDRIALKIKHTYGVVQFSEFLAKQLNLSEEDTYLAKLIGLLHDIGRFEQAKRFDDFTDGEKMDHAEYGVKILFEEGLIRNFIAEDTFDSIIYQAILNHNRYQIAEGLNQRALLHAKIIRDSDKLDNFIVKQTQSFYTLYRKSEEEIRKQTITEKVFQDFLQGRCIEKQDQRTNLDSWVCIIAFIFDLNFRASFQYLQDNNSIPRLINRISYEKEDTKNKMNKMKIVAKKYIENKLKEENI